MSKRTIRVAVLALAALALVATGCGDDSADSTTTTKKDTTTTTEERSTSTTSPDDGPDDTTGGSGGAGTSEECAELGTSFQSLDVQGMMSAFKDGTDPTKAFQDFADAMDGAKEHAPAAISDDVAELAEGYATMAEASEGIDWSKAKSGDPAVSADAAKLMQTFSSEDLAGAAQRVSDWINENCVPGASGSN